VRTCKVRADRKADASGLREAYVKRGKNDATDAEAICEAVTRPNMRFVPVKSADQQAVLMLHRTRALLIRQQTMLANAFRAHLAELGIVVPQRHQACARTDRESLWRTRGYH
jgi:transposase